MRLLASCRLERHGLLTRAGLPLVGTRMPLQLAPAPAPSSANLADVLFMMEASQVMISS